MDAVENVGIMLIYSFGDMKFHYLLIVSILLIVLGAAVTKLTLRDEIVLTEADQDCKRIDYWVLYDHPFERFGIGLLGKTAVISKDGNSLHINAYALFRIPVGKSIMGCGGEFSYKIPTTENGIKRAIEQARYCDVKSDCAQVQPKCPFGCGIFVNKNEAERINASLESYVSRCIYQCIMVKDYDCVNQKCQVLY